MIGWFLFGFIIAFGLCSKAEENTFNIAVESGMIELKGTWYKLEKM